MGAKGKLCVIISGGQYSPIELPEAAEYVIACDKGYEYALRDRIKPDLVIGDFDSCNDEIRAQMENDKSDLIWERYPSEKDDTDTMLAVKRAIELGYQQIGIYCGFGGRMDHFYANIQSMVYAAKQGVACYMENRENYIYVQGPGRVELPRREGWSVSMFAATEVCSGITTTGVKYALKDGELTNSFPLGVSNEWDGELATVEVKAGVLLIMLADKGVKV